MIVACSPPVEWLAKWNGKVSDLAMLAAVSATWFVDAEGAEEMAAVVLQRRLARAAAAEATMVAEHREGEEGSAIVALTPSSSSASSSSSSSLSATGSPPNEGRPATLMSTVKRVAIGRVAELMGPSLDKVHAALQSEDWMVTALGVSVAATGLQLMLSDTSRAVLHRTVAGMALATSMTVGALAGAALFVREPARDAVEFALHQRRPDLPRPPALPPSAAPVRHDPTPRIAQTVAAASLGSVAAGWLVQSATSVLQSSTLLQSSTAALLSAADSLFRPPNST
jgi:hypothetical protein